MDIQNIMNAIATVGFPIVACAALFWMINKSMKELTAAVNNNTSALHTFTERMNLTHEKDGN